LLIFCNLRFRECILEGFELFVKTKNLDKIYLAISSVSDRVQTDL
jgi:hypothetical protein